MKQVSPAQTQAANQQKQSPQHHASGIWQEYVPQCAWGTLWLAAGIATGYAVVIPAAMLGYLPYPLATLVCAYLAFASFTVMHDAGHGSLIQIGSSLKFLESGIAWLASLPLLIAPFRLFQKIHDRHHAFTNDPDRDPDHYTFGDKWYQVALNSLYIPLQYHIMSVTTLRHIPAIRRSYPSTVLYAIAVFGTMAWLIHSGYLQEILYFAILPAVIAVFFLAMFFDYIPHHPHKALGRYHNTRIFPGRLGNILLLGQNYHLIHHLYPRVPWYRYVDVYQRILPELEARNAPIENVTGGQRPRLLQSPDARRLQDEGRTLHHVLRVNDIVRLTPDAVMIRFDLPSGQRLQYQAGQYITLSKWLDGQQLSRCYSLCSCPSYGEITIGVRKTPAGLFSGYLHEQLSVGDELVVQGPGGDFVYPPTHQQAIDHLVLIAGGSGITPIKAILEAALEDSSQGLITLIYASRDPEHSMFLAALKALAEKHRHRFTMHMLFSSGRDSRENRLNAQTLAHLIPDLATQGETGSGRRCEFYLCGPQGLTQTVLDTLTHHKVDPFRIHHEAFTAGISAPEGQQHQVDVKLADGETHQLQVASNQTVLEVAKANGVPLPHACGNGTCGTCKLKLDKGKVHNIPEEKPGLTSAERSSGYVLACQCRPYDALSLSETRL